MPAYGTRVTHTAIEKGAQPPQGKPHAIITRDLGLNTLATAAMTFVAGSIGTINVTAANGTFPNFAKDMQIELIGTGANDGFYEIIGVDGTNQSYLKLTPSVPMSLGPVTATIRTL